jgi:hypothetical protein
VKAVTSDACTRAFGPHPLNELRTSPEAYGNGRKVTDRWYLVHADFSACSEHRLDVLRDVTQRSHFVSPRAREYEPAAIEPPEIWPLKLSPCFFKSRKRPPSFYMLLPQHGHIPHTSCNIATGIKYSSAQLRNLTTDTVVEDE